MNHKGYTFWVEFAPKFIIIIVVVYLIIAIGISLIFHL
jgi:hypothetical protein